MESAGVFRSAVRARLEHVAGGRIEMLESGRASTFGPAGGLRASVFVHDPRFFRRVALGGTIGAADAFVDGWWSCDDLVALIRILARDARSADGLERGWATLVRPFQRLWHWSRRNHRGGSRRNVREHYDLGNAFFALWLDPTMTYSCGVYETSHSTLQDASVAKLHRICRQLALAPGQRVLEIGTGWGSFAMHAARHYGVHVTTTTISAAQHAEATSRVKAAGLGDRVSVLLRDYRDLAGRFDRIVSIEMIEAVGHAYHAAFLRACRDLLVEDGEMLLQAITIADQRYARALAAPDFIQRRVFPGSSLLSVTRLCDVATRATDFRLVHLDDITEHYARTLADWRRAFLARAADVRKLGFDDRFLRLWEFYLAYCEAGFSERHIGDVQAHFVRPGFRRALTPAPAPVAEAVGSGASR